MVPIPRSQLVPDGRKCRTGAIGCKEFRMAPYPPGRIPLEQQTLGIVPIFWQDEPEEGTPDVLPMVRPV